MTKKFVLAAPAILMCVGIGAYFVLSDNAGKPSNPAEESGAASTTHEPPAAGPGKSAAEATREVNATVPSADALSDEARLRALASEKAYEEAGLEAVGSLASRYWTGTRSRELLVFSQAFPNTLAGAQALEIYLSRLSEADAAELTKSCLRDSGGDRCRFVAELFLLNRALDRNDRPELCERLERLLTLYPLAWSAASRPRAVATGALEAVGHPQAAETLDAALRAHDLGSFDPHAVCAQSSGQGVVRALRNEMDSLFAADYACDNASYGKHAKTLVASLNELRASDSSLAGLPSADMRGFLEDFLKGAGRLARLKRSNFSSGSQTGLMTDEDVLRAVVDFICDLPGRVAWSNEEIISLASISGQTLAKAGFQEPGERLYRMAVDTTEDDVRRADVAKELAEIYLNWWRTPDAAVELLERVREKTPSPELTLMLARAYDLRGDHEKVIDSLGEYLNSELTPEQELNALFLLGQALGDAGRTEEMRTVLAQVHERATDLRMKTAVEELLAQDSAAKPADNMEAAH